jgi:hypothetical protein
LKRFEDGAANLAHASFGRSVTHESPHRDRCPRQTHDRGNRQDYEHNRPVEILRGPGGALSQFTGDSHEHKRSLHEQRGDRVCKNETSWPQGCRRLQTISHPLMDACLERIAPLLMETRAIQRPAARSAVNHGSLFQRERRIATA